MWIAIFLLRFFLLFLVKTFVRRSTFSPYQILNNTYLLFSVLLIICIFHFFKDWSVIEYFFFPFKKKKNSYFLSSPDSCSSLDQLHSRPTVLSSPWVSCPWILGKAHYLYSTFLYLLFFTLIPKELFMKRWREHLWVLRCEKWPLWIFCVALLYSLVLPRFWFLI